MEIRSQIPSTLTLDNVSDRGGTVSALAAQPMTPAAVHADSATIHFASALSGDDVRLERVQHLQSRIAAGTYQVAPEAVADKMLEMMRTP